MKEHLELEDKFKERVQEAIKYVSTIDDFDELVDPRTLARQCLGSKPLDYVLHAIDREQKKCELSYVRLSLFLFLGTNFSLPGAEMTTKFNKEMYTKIKGKKNKSFLPSSKEG